jgi:hypothetical protein
MKENKILKFNSFFNKGAVISPSVMEEDDEDLGSLDGKENTDKEEIKGSEPKGDEPKEEYPDELGGLEDGTTLKQSSSSKKKGKGGVKYKENMTSPKMDAAKHAATGHITYFTYALSALDKLLSINISVSKNEKKKQDLVNDYNKIIRDIKVEPSYEGVVAAWEKVASLADSMNKEAPKVMSENPVIKKMKDLAATLKQKLDRGEITQEEYKEEINAAKEEALDATNSLEIVNIGQYSQASDLLYKAISKFKDGGVKELERIEKSDDPKLKNAYFEVVADSIGSIAKGERRVKSSEDQAEERLRKEEEGYKKKGEKEDKELETKLGKSEPPKETIGDSVKESDIFVESFGGFLNRGREFISNVGAGIKDLAGQTAFAKKGGSELTAGSILTAAENLKGSIMSLASEIDNVIGYQENVTGEAGSEGVKTDAKESASEIIQFTRDSFKYLMNIQNELKSGTPSKVQSKLDEISKKLGIIVRPGGVLSQWKDSVMGKGRESVVAAGNLSQGIDLMKKADELLSSITDRKYLQKRAKGNEATAQLKKAMDAFRGVKKEEKKLPSLIGKKKYKTFPANPTDKDKEAVSDFQNKLKSLSYLSGSDFKDGQYDSKTKDAADRAMQFLGTITGKVYGTQEEAFRDFQNDLGLYYDNKSDIQKKLGVK